jgi:hypothetical protein
MLRAAVSIIANCRPLSIVDAAPSAAGLETSSAVLDTRPERSSKSDLRNAGSIADVGLAVSAWERNSSSRVVKAVIAGAAGLSISCAAMMRD